MGIAAFYDEAGQYGMSHRAFIRPEKPLQEVLEFIQILRANLTPPAGIDNAAGYEVGIN